MAEHMQDYIDEYDNKKNANTHPRYKRSRNYLITIPIDNDSSLSRDDIIERCGMVKAQYYFFAEHVSQKGLSCYRIFIHCKNPSYFEKIRNAFNVGIIEQYSGNLKDIYCFIKGEGRYSSKADHLLINNFYERGIQ